MRTAARMRAAIAEIRARREIRDCGRGEFDVRGDSCVVSCISVRFLIREAGEGVVALGPGPACGVEEPGEPGGGRPNEERRFEGEAAAARSNLCDGEGGDVDG